MEEENTIKVSIIGLGWLGLPLAKHLLKEGFDARGSKTLLPIRGVKSYEGVKAFHLEAIPEVVCLQPSDLFDADVLIISIPPDRKRDDVEEFYPGQVHHISKFAMRYGVRRCLFTSSTSVYGDEAREVNEDSELNPTTYSGRAVVNAEMALKELWGDSCTILRLGGLMGPNRHPGRFFGDRNNVPGGSKPVNLVHLDEILGATQMILKEDLWGRVFNVVIPDHPTRAEFYPEAARLGNFDIPEFVDDAVGGKIVNSSLESVGYKFRYTSLLDALK